MNYSAQQNGMTGDLEDSRKQHAFDRGSKSILLEQKSKENFLSSYVFNANL